MRLDECLVRPALNVIEGKWKPLILFQLKSGRKRFSELQKLLPEATQKVLTQQLRELERDGVIFRKVYPTIPPRVEYAFTPNGRKLRPALEALCNWTVATREESKNRPAAH
jgi:DNA-binding HxlR family transcriptional regulator